MSEAAEQNCKWCDDAVLGYPQFLDRDGVLCSISGEPGILSHAYDDSWWPCLKFGVEMRCSRAQAARDTAGANADGRDACWHCGVVLAWTLKPRCEDCPEECDVENCDEMGCATTSIPIPTTDKEPTPLPETLSEAWQTYFERLGIAATVDVVNATANLVIAEREIYAAAAKRDTWEQAIKIAQRTLCAYCEEAVDSNDVSPAKGDSHYWKDDDGYAGECKAAETVGALRSQTTKQ